MTIGSRTAAIRCELSDPTRALLTVRQDRSRAPERGCCHFVVAAIFLYTSASVRGSPVQTAQTQGGHCCKVAIYSDQSFFPCSLQNARTLLRYLSICLRQYFFFSGFLANDRSVTFFFDFSSWSAISVVRLERRIQCSLSSTRKMQSLQSLANSYRR